MEPVFDPVASRIPGSRAILERLAWRRDSDSTTSLENALADIAADASPERRRQLLAFRFFLNAVISDFVDGAWLKASEGMTGYLSLLNFLLDWRRRSGTRVLLGTFNWDLLLDTAARDVVSGWQLGALTEYVERDDFRLFKLHGSTDWSRLISHDETVNVPMLEACIRRSEADGEFQGDIVHQPPPQLVQLDGRVLLPAIAAPMANKTDFECPPHHLDALGQDLPNVTHVLIVGWRAAEAHAVALLDSIPRRVALGIVTKDRESQRDLARNLGPFYDRSDLRLAGTEGFARFFGRDSETQLNYLLRPSQ